MIMENLKRDIPASIVVFLVALPLCLGIALASGAPMISGIISGIVGGIVAGLISKSQTSVSGPAAGLSSVVLSSIKDLADFELFLSAVILAGLIQLIMGIARVGFIAEYVPSNVIKGLLAAIGIILILKQIPHAIGFDKNPEGDFRFQVDNHNTFSDLITAVEFITPGALVISLVSILLLVYWDKTPLKEIKFIPSPLFVVILGVILNIVFPKFIPVLTIESSHLVQIPQIDSSQLSSFFHVPESKNLVEYKVWIVAFTLAVIASLETLLNIDAIDKIDPKKRNSPPNRELLAQGIANITTGFLGGIPVTSVIVRSSANINAGNDTKLSTVLHGLFMFVSVFTLSNFLNLIPLASLACILLWVGYKLAKISLFKEMYQKGLSQFIPFMVTIIAILFTDLLIGVLLGLAVSIFYLMKSNFRNPFIKDSHKLATGEVIKLELSHQVSFFNKAIIRQTLWDIPPKSKVLIDASNSVFIDNDVLEILKDFKEVVAHERSIQLNIIGLKEKYQLKDQIRFTNVLDKETQQKLKPTEILDLLKAGNDRFIKGKFTNKYFLLQVKASSTGQNPMALIVACMDSRTSPEIIFDVGLGDLITIRIAGNIISPEILGSIELAVEKLGVKLIIVKGHSRCSAVSLSLTEFDKENIGLVTKKIKKAVKQCGLEGNNPEEINDTVLEKVIKQNVCNSIEDILENSSYLKTRNESMEIAIVSAYHDISTGKVHFGDKKLQNSDKYKN
jgi:MFS superfamily sulfate permease-like transporter